MKINIRHIDNNFYQISGKAAHYLCRKYTDPVLVGKSVVPKPGYERKLLVGFQTFWLKRTVVMGQTVWALHYVADNFNGWVGNIHLYTDFQNSVKRGYFHA